MAGAFSSAFSSAFDIGAAGNRRRRVMIAGRQQMQWAKQSTAVSYVIGPILDSAGAEYTGAVIGDISLSKNGGTLTALASAATLTHVANGQYTLALTTGNTDTLGTGRILCNKSTYQMPTLEIMVLPATVYDALTANATNTTGGLLAATAAISALAGALSQTGDSFARLGAPAGASVSADVAAVKADTAAVKAKTDNLPAAPASTTNITAGTITTTTNLTNLPVVPTDWLTGAGVKADAVTKIQSGLATSSDVTTIEAALTVIVGLIDTEIAAIKAKTDQLTFTTMNKVDATLQLAADLAATVAAKIADTILRRHQANAEGSSDGDSLSVSSLYGMIQQAQESNTVDNAGELTIYQTNGTTELGRKTVDTDADAEPVVGVS